MNRRLLVLGAGIKGSAIAALAALTTRFEVTLVDRIAPGAGTTSTNHGRLHSGASEWYTRQRELDDAGCRRLLQRQSEGSALVRRLPNGTVSTDPALYCFEKQSHWEGFKTFCNNYNIRSVDCNPKLLENPWIENNRYCHIVEVPEFSFNPARLAGRLAQTCINSGGGVRAPMIAEAVKPTVDGLDITFKNKSVVSADLVVNAMTRWCNSIELPVGAEATNIQWRRWRILCLRLTSPSNQINRVITVSGEAAPSAIPHGNWITLDYNGVTTKLALSPEEADDDWRPFCPSDSNDAEIFQAVSDAFPPVRELARNSSFENLYSLAGIHARLVVSSSAALGSAPRGSVAQLFERIPNYFVAFGGQATTAILDAMDIVESLYVREIGTNLDRDELFTRLVNSLAPTPCDGSWPMRWEQQ